MNYEFVDPNKPASEWKLWELAQEALDCVKIVEKWKNYKVDMDYYYFVTKQKNKKPICSVCAAGCFVAANRIMPDYPVTDPKSEHYYSPYDFNYNIMTAIDDLRRGHCEHAGYYIYNCNTPNIKNFNITNYNENKSQWKKDMREMIKYLKDNNI